MSPSFGSCTTQQLASPPPTSVPTTGATRRDRVTVIVVRCYLLALLGLGVACSSEGSATKQEKPTETRKLAGVYPDKFQCESLTKTEELVTALGATKVNMMVGQFSPPKGVPQPCNYEVVMQDHVEYWTYDLDCRDDMKQRADALFEQYKKSSADHVAQYDHMTDAGLVKPTDAGIVIKRPEDAVEVQVGAKALDHHGQGLIFIDDDAPCYVRVIGPDAAHRLELAKLLATKLTFANAPMTPRPAK